MKREKKGARGVPRNLRALAEAGHRIRFHGGWLGSSEVDRTVAEWIDQTPNAWAVAKWLLYMMIKGKLILAEDAASVVPDEPVAQDEYEEIANALLRFDT